MTDLTTTLRQAFERGDYHRVAATGNAENWRTHAALGLCGNVAPALERLASLGDSDAAFHEGVIRWIDGDEASAVRLLSRCDNEHADNLLCLIRKPRLSVLTQLPWQRSLAGPHTLLQAGQMDPKFHLRNISFTEADLPNAPNADIHDFYDAGSPPDFYLAEMVEWHLIPPNLQELPCPTIGQTGDYDLHIQTVYPWLRQFDELVVTDSTEYADVARLVDAPVTTFCKPVSLPLHLLPEIDVPRDLDLVLTGSVLHSYFPDKAEMMRQMLATDDFEPYFLSGFLFYYVYYPVLARSKLSVALTRHLGAIPSRGYEALAMGTVLLAPQESCMRLFADQDEGVYPFSLKDNGLKSAIATVMADYGRYAEAALRGRSLIRDAFDPFRVASEYLRMATFLAARPRPPRQTAPRPLQKRSVAYKGWLQENDRQTHMALRNTSLERWKAIAPQDHTLETFCDPARELMLEYEHCTLMPGEESHEALVQTALNIYRSALPQFPDALALRFNYARAAFHFGVDADVEAALAVTKETLERDPTTFTLDPLDDVMTWDYCQNFFNYRGYLQIVTEALCEGDDRSGDLKRLVLASLKHYYGRMAKDDNALAQAAALDPDFSVYRLWHGKALARAGASDKAIAVLSSAIPEILFAPESWSLIQALKIEHNATVPNESALRELVGQMESRTLIDEAYAAIRVGLYFRKQRLSLAQNPGVEFRKRTPRETPPALSILLADTNGARYQQLLSGLEAQSLHRRDYEIILCDVFDRESPAALQHADTVMVLGQNEHLYNRNAAFNFALAEATGATVVFCDTEQPLPENALGEITARAAPYSVLVNCEGSEPDSIHTVALERNAALQAGGLDESAYYAGAYSGPYELVARLDGQRWRIETLDCLPPSRPDRANRTLQKLFNEIWPTKFSPYRVMPLRESPEIAALRQKL